jgi:hypothetical protein
MDQTKLLTTVLKWGKAFRLDDFEIATAQSLAWYHQSQYQGPELPESHWARLAVRHVRFGRDLPGCGTPEHDALNKCWLGAGMAEVMDRYPGPSTLAAHKETLERILKELSEIKREIAELRLSGMANKEIALHVNLSPARVSQIAGEIARLFKESE